MITQQIKLLALAFFSFVSFVSFSSAADSEKPEIELAFDAPFYSVDAQINLYHPASKKLFTYQLSGRDEVAAFARKILVPQEVAGRCHLFIDWRPSELGSQHFEVTCEKGKTAKISVRQNHTDFQLKLPPEIARKAQSTGYIVRLFRLNADGFDPYFAVQWELPALNGAEIAPFSMTGAVKGNYILTLAEVKSDVPLYCAKFVLPHDDFAGLVTIELGEKQAFDGIAAPFATISHGWWTSIWLVDDKGVPTMIEERPAK